MYLETPKKFRSLANQAHQVAENYFRPISRKYDKAEHAYPKELDLLAALLDGMNSGSPEAVGATSASKRAGKQVEEGIKNGGNLSALLGVMELCWGDVGLLLAMPRQGWAMRRSPRWPTRSSCSASAAPGRQWRSPSRAAARTRRRSAPPRPRMATTMY